MGSILVVSVILVLAAFIIFKSSFSNMIKAIFIFSILVLIAIVIFLKLCYVESEVERPESIPDEAVWVGGKDGGCWINVSDQLSKNNFYIEIFFEGGQIWAKDTFKLEERSCPIISLDKEKLTRSLNSFNGERVSFKYQEKICYLHKVSTH